MLTQNFATANINNIAALTECNFDIKIKFIIPPKNQVPFDLRQALAKYYKLDACYNNNDKIGIATINEVHLERAKMEDRINIDNNIITNPYL